MEEKRITINVSGTHYEISETTMDRLMQLNSHAGQVILEQKKENKQVFYFERHPGIFMVILNKLNIIECNYFTKATFGNILLVYSPKL